MSGDGGRTGTVAAGTVKCPLQLHEHCSSGEVGLQPSRYRLERKGQKQFPSGKGHLSPLLPIAAELGRKRANSHYWEGAGSREIANLPFLPHTLVVKVGEFSQRCQQPLRAGWWSQEMGNLPSLPHTAQQSLGKLRCPSSTSRRVPCLAR